MINLEIQDFEQGMSRDTIRCFLELQESEIEDEEKLHADQYLHYLVNTNEKWTLCMNMQPMAILNNGSNLSCDSLLHEG